MGYTCADWADDNMLCENGGYTPEDLVALLTNCCKTCEALREQCKIEFI